MNVLEAGPVADLGQAMALGAKVVQSSGLLGGKSCLPSMAEIWVSTLEISQQKYGKTTF